MINVGLATQICGRNIQRMKKEAGFYNKRGVYVGGFSAPETICATVHPMSGSMLKDMPEGVRNEAKLRVDSIIDIANDDLLEIDGDQYRVCHKWPTSSQSYSRVAVALKDDPDER